jgi:hypothetical protein
MSRRELERVGVMGRVDSGALRLKDAAAMLELSYRQAKRLWRRYRQVGGKGLQHGNAGRPCNRSKPLKLRRQVLNLIKKNIPARKRNDWGRRWRRSTWRKKTGLQLITKPCAVGCWRKDCGASNGGERNTANEESANRTLANWCSWTGAFTIGWSSVGRGVA